MASGTGAAGGGTARRPRRQRQLGRAVCTGCLPLPRRRSAGLGTQGQKVQTALITGAGGTLVEVLVEELLDVEVEPRFEESEVCGHLQEF